MGGPPVAEPGVFETTVRIDMPRPTKAFHRQRVSAAAAWSRGEKKEAYKLWEAAAASLKEHRAKKHNNKKPPEEADSTDTPG